MTAKRDLSHAFEHASLPHGDDGRLVRGVKVPCGGCGIREPLHMNTLFSRGGTDSDEVEFKNIQKRMTAKGWRIERQREHHRCPRCLERERLAKVGKETKGPPITTLVQPPRSYPEPLKFLKEAPMTPAKAPPATEPQREFKIADRRIINLKICEVYQDEKVGYCDGWSDQRIADDLGVPRAWVRTVREENFGDEGGNEETRKKVAEAQELMTKIKALEPHFEEARKLFGLADAMARDLAQIAKVLR